MEKENFNLKEEYDKFAKKYKLPEFEIIDEDLELSLSIEKQKFLLKNIRRRLHDKLAFFARILEGVIYPNTSSLVAMQEAKYFTDNEKSEMSKIYKKIVSIERASNVLDIESSEKEESSFIIATYKEFKSIKKEIKSITEKMVNSWNKEDMPESEGYFG